MPIPSQITFSRRATCEEIRGQRRAASARLLGFVAVFIAAGLLALFAVAPHLLKGTLPECPGAWRGGPLIMLTAFLGIYGTFVIVLRRYSLAAFLTGVILSGALATGLQLYVQSIQETTALQSYYVVPSDKASEFVKRSRSLLTPDRLVSFAVALSKVNGHPIDFSSVAITYGATSSNQHQVGVTLSFKSSPYIHPFQTDSRLNVEMYAKLANSWIAARLRTSDMNPATILQENDRTDYSTVDLRIFEVLRDITAQKKLAGSYHDALEWVRDQEPDEDFHQFLSDLLKEIERVMREDPRQYRY